MSSPQGNCSVNRSKWHITCIFISEEAVKSELSNTRYLHVHCVHCLLTLLTAMYLDGFIKGDILTMASLWGLKF